MAWKWNPFTNNLDYYETGTTDPATTVEIIHVANFSALPDPTTVGLYDIYIVDAAQGTRWLPGSVGGTYYPAGAYYSNLVNWVYSESAGQATQAEVNTGTVTDKFVTPETFSNASKWATKLDADSSINALNDVTISNPLTNQLLQFNGSQWINASGAAINAGPGVVYFLTDVSAGISTYEYFSKTPDSGVEVQESVTVNNNTVLIHEYISDTALGKTSIDAGIWEFNFFSYVDHYHASFVVDVYKRDVGGAETLLFSVETDSVSWIATALTSAVTVQQAFICNATDRLVVKISGKTSGNGDVILTLVHSGTQHYSHFHTPLILLHNDIAGLQGGAANEYYHLSSAVNTTLLGWSTSGIPDVNIQSASIWNAKAPLDNPSFTTKITTPYAVISGTAGGGYIALPSQSSDAPIATASTDLNLYNNGGHMAWRRGSSGYIRTFSATLTNNRTWTLPDASGTVALTSDLTTKADLASPTFTGIPLSTTAASGTNTTQIATTAFVQDALSKQQEAFQFAASDETLALTVGTNKVTLPMPYSMTAVEVRGFLVTPQTSGTIFTADIKKNGVSILSTLITIDNGERTSKTAAIPPVISTSALTDDDVITVDVTQIGDGTAKGLKILIKGPRT